MRTNVIFLKMLHFLALVKLTRRVIAAFRNLAGRQTKSFRVRFALIDFSL